MHFHGSSVDGDGGGRRMQHFLGPRQTLTDAPERLYHLVAVVGVATAAPQQFLNASYFVGQMSRQIP